MIENAFGRYYLPELDVLHLFKSLCEAVLAFHECDPPLAHRDIKVYNDLLLQLGFGKYCICMYPASFLMKI
jgi:serine/threonine protein kinase